MQKFLVLTICIGKRYGKIGTLTLPLIQAYAARIGAEYLCLSDKNTADISPHFAKFQLHRLLGEYDRIIYLDADLLIREDTPNLFDRIPEDTLGAFNESPYTQGRAESMLQAAQAYGIELSQEVQQTYKGEYYNTGVLVLSRMHGDLFVPPEEQHLLPFFEQSLINARIIAGQVKVKDLTYAFNRMTCMDTVTGEDRHASYIIHYAGCPFLERQFLEVIEHDIDIWKQTAPDFRFKRHLVIDVTGGLGDQVSAEPVVRHAIEKEFNGCDIHIVTHFPRIYAHLKELDNVSVYMAGTRLGGDMPFMRIGTIAGERHMFSQFAFHGLMHPADYSSILMLRKQIPNSDKKIKLKVGLHDVEELVASVGLHQFFDFVAVHPGRGWDSKTFPTAFWNEVLKGLVAHNIPTVVIGKYVSREQGTIEDLEIPAGVRDWRNKLSLPSLIAFLSQARVLVSNDSAPIHIAGAFDNHILLIPSCKHPDHVLPYREGTQYHKACALYQTLLVDKFFESDITEDQGKTTAQIPAGARYEDYLPLPETVVLETVKRYSP